MAERCEGFQAEQARAVQLTLDERALLLAVASYIVLHEGNCHSWMAADERTEAYARIGGRHGGLNVMETLMPLIRSIARTQP